LLLGTDIREQFQTAKGAADAIDRGVAARASPQLTPCDLASRVLIVVSGEDDKTFLASRAGRRPIVLGVFNSACDRLTKESVLLNLRVVDSNR
jgi:hypothetical protein